MSTKVEALCISRKKGERKTPSDIITLVAGHGIEGDAHAGSWHRQVSLLAAEDIESMKAKGLPDLAWGDFAENLVTSGLDLSLLGLGSRIRFGDDAEISLTQLGKTCHSRCAIYFLAGDCIMPRLGVFARVTHGGTVRPGDEVHIERVVSRKTFQAVVITVSDRCSKGEAEDTSGPAVAEFLAGSLDCHVYTREIVPDGKEPLSSRLKHFCDGHSIDLVLTAGGTGFSPRDLTPETVSSVIERPTPGLDETMRRMSAEKTPLAALSRSVSGIRGQTLILSLPGSRTGAVESLQAVLPLLPHGLAKLRGDAGDCGREESE